MFKILEKACKGLDASSLGSISKLGAKTLQIDYPSHMQMLVFYRVREVVAFVIPG